MIGVAAKAVVTTMENGHIVWNGTIDSNPHGAVRERGLAMVGGLAIAVRSTMARPFPTFVGRSPVNVRPKPVKYVGLGPEPDAIVMRCISIVLSSNVAEPEIRPGDNGRWLAASTLAMAVGDGAHGLSHAVKFSIGYRTSQEREYVDASIR